jgi:hypothetical protein
MVHSTEIVTDFYCTVSFRAVGHSVQPNPPQWPAVHNQIRRSGPRRLTKQWPIPWPGRNLKVEYLGTFESIFEIALDHESGDQ